MDLISEWIAPGTIVLIFGMILGFILGWSFHKLWLVTKTFTYRFIPGPLKTYGHWVIFVGIIIFAIVWTVLR